MDFGENQDRIIALMVNEFMGQACNTVCCATIQVYVCWKGEIPFCPRPKKETK